MSTLQAIYGMGLVMLITWYWSALLAEKERKDFLRKQAKGEQHDN